MASTTLLKKDALVHLTLGGGFIQRLQQMFMQLTDEQPQEELEIFLRLAKEGAKFSEPWMEHLYTLHILLVEIEKSAIASGQTVQEPL